jgi:FkbM family methyltransferase
MHNQIFALKFMRLVNNQLSVELGRKNQGIVLDLGANVGHFSHAARKMGFRVVAVEPHPEALKYLAKRFSRDKKVEIIPKAIGNQTGKTVLNFHPDHSNDRIQTSISASTISDKFIGEY